MPITAKKSAPKTPKRPFKGYSKNKVVRSAVSFISLILVLGGLLPAIARASVLSALFAPVASAAPQTNTSSGNLQTMSLLKPAYNLNPAPATGGGDVTIVDNSAVAPQDGPSGTIADIVKPKNATISTYIVQPGDTLSSIAKLFGITTGTILSANDLPRNAVIKPGDELVILPITSISYTVKKGDTIESIAKAYNGDVTEIESYNGVDNSSLAAGQQILIPNAEAIVTAAPPSTTKNSSGSNTKKSSGTASTKVMQGASASCGATIPLANNPAEPSHNVGPAGTCDQIAYYIAPLAHYVQSQGIHGYNAVDLAAPSGSPIMAAADGTVVVARSGGWNGGYGSYVVISHSNGSQTLYAHMSEVDAYDGESVVQGQVIGEVGMTGEATGPHVHFEIRNGIRNPF